MKRIETLIKQIQPTRKLAPDLQRTAQLKNDIMPHRDVMIIRKFQQKDINSLVDLLLKVFPDDPPHNKPAKVIDQKFAVDDLIFAARSADLVGSGDGPR